MLLGTLDARLLENLLIGKGTIRAGEAKIRAGWVTIREAQVFQCHLILWPISRYQSIIKNNQN